MLCIEQRNMFRKKGRCVSPAEESWSPSFPPYRRPVSEIQCGADNTLLWNRFAKLCLLDTNLVPIHFL